MIDLAKELAAFKQKYRRSCDDVRSQPFARKLIDAIESAREAEEK